MEENNNCVEIEKGKEFDYFSKEILQNFIMDFHKDIENQKEKKLFYKGAVAYKSIENLEGKKVDVWIEWNARRFGDALDIGIICCIFYDVNTIPDVVLDKWNLMAKEVKKMNNSK